MKKIVYLNINELLTKNYNIEILLKKMDIIIKNNYPNFEKYFLEKIIPDLYSNNRNIIIAYKNNEIIGFVNLKKNDNTISNIYIKQCIYYNKILNNLINESTRWLETDKPKLIISKKEINNYVNLIINRGWTLTNVNNYNMIFNGKGNEFERLIYKKKSLKK